MKKKDLYRSIIVKNFTKPTNWVENEPDGYFSFFAVSNICSEFYKIFFKFQGSKIIDAKFSGHGCSISKASLNIGCSMLKNKSINYALDLILNYKKMINDQQFDHQIIADLIIFKDMLVFANRKTCAFFAFQKIFQTITDLKKDQKDSTTHHDSN